VTFATFFCFIKDVLILIIIIIIILGRGFSPGREGEGEEEGEGEGEGRNNNNNISWHRYILSSHPSRISYDNINITHYDRCAGIILSLKWTGGILI